MDDILAVQERYSDLDEPDSPTSTKTH